LKRFFGLCEVDKKGFTDSSLRGCQLPACYLSKLSIVLRSELEATSPVLRDVERLAWRTVRLQHGQRHGRTLVL
jgi:hypothetical protein